MKHQLERQLGKRGQWVLVPVLGAIAIWVVFFTFDSPIAQIISKLGVSGVLVILVLLLLEVRQKLWTLASQSRALDNRVSDLQHQLDTTVASPSEPEHRNSHLDRHTGKADLDAMAVKLENEIRSGFRSLSHNKSTDEAVLRLEAYARHVIAVTTVAASRQSNELQADRSASTGEGI